MKIVRFAGIAVLLLSSVVFAEEAAKADAAPASKSATKAEAKPEAKSATADAKAEPAAKDAAASEDAKAEPAAKDAAASTNVEAKTCKSVENHECQDASDSFDASAGSMVLWTKVKGMEGAEIHHVWFKGDQSMGDVTLKVGGSPWRTYSRKSLSDDMKGDDWRVEVRDANGAVLQTVKFSVK